MLDALLERGCYVGVATHDEWLLERALERVARAGAGSVRAPDAARRSRGARGASSSPRATGSASTCPYGERWYEYSLRRLQENPALATMLAKATVLRVVPGRS